jgi:hypothetical protein
MTAYSLVGVCFCIAVLGAVWYQNRAVAAEFGLAACICFIGMAWYAVAEHYSPRVVESKPIPVEPTPVEPSRSREMAAALIAANYYHEENKRRRDAGP